MNPAEIQQKVCVSGETHVDVTILVVRVVFVCLVIWYVWFLKLGCIRCCYCIKNILNFAFSPVVLGIHEISYAISLKIRL